MSEWISVKDRFPEDCTRVLSFIDNQIVFLYWNGACWTYQRYVLKDSAVTHWMPLPEPPKD